MCDFLLVVNTHSSCLVFEKIAFFLHFGDRQTNKQTNRTDALSRSRYRNRRLNNDKIRNTRHQSTPATFGKRLKTFIFTEIFNITWAVLWAIVMSASASQIIYVRGHKTDDDHFHQFYFYINVVVTTLCLKKHVTTSSLTSWTRIVRLQQFLAHLLPRV